MTSTTERTNEYYRTYNKRMRRLKLIRKIVVQAIMTLLAFVILYPFIMSVGVSVKSPLEALLSPDKFPTEFPGSYDYYTKR